MCAFFSKGGQKSHTLIRGSEVFIKIQNELMSLSCHIFFAFEYGSSRYAGGISQRDIAEG